MTRKIVVNGVRRDMTAEEEAKVDADLATTQAEKTSVENARQERLNLKASAKAKLVAGEPLTDEEADTIVL